MRIGLDGLPLNQQLTGVGHYTLELATAMAQAARDDNFEIVSPRPFIFDAGGAQRPDGWPPNLSLVRAPANFVTRRWWTIGLPRHVARNPLDLFHGTNFEVPLWTNRGCPTVLTIHDLSLLLHPDTHEERQVRRARRRTPLMARAATMIITPTESVRSELCENLPVAHDKVVAVPEAPRTMFRPMPPDESVAIRKRLGAGEDFLLFVGTIEPRKDLGTLVCAFEQVAQARGPGLELVIAGRRGWLFDGLLERIGKSALVDRIKLIGYVNDEELRALYSSCRAFVYPSIYEGFGLPPIEAMACGAPVIAGRIASVVEVCREAALFVEPKSVDALAGAIATLLADDATRRRVAAAGLRRAADFSWKSTAELTREVYREAIRRFRGNDSRNK